MTNDSLTSGDLAVLIPDQPHTCQAIGGALLECLGCRVKKARSTIARMDRGAAAAVAAIDASLTFAPKPCRAAMLLVREVIGG